MMMMPSTTTKSISLLQRRRNPVVVGTYGNTNNHHFGFNKNDRFYHRPSTTAQRRFVSTSTTLFSCFTSLQGKAFVSIEDCLAAYQEQEEKRQSQQDSISDNNNTNAPSKSNNVFFIDGTWFHKGSRNGRQEYLDGPRIPNSIHIDIDDLSCQHKWFPSKNPKQLKRMLPPPMLFAAAMDFLGITNNDHIIFYGRQGCYFLPRLWFMFYSMGHTPKKLHLMQGSFEEWMDVHNGPVEHDILQNTFEAKDLFPLSTNYNYRVNEEPTNVCDLHHVLTTNFVNPTNKDNNDNHDKEKITILLDPRGSKSFNVKGHIPGAINIPYISLVCNDNTLKFKSSDELKQIFNKAIGVDDLWSSKTKLPNILCSCGTGVSVCNVLVALNECGYDLSPTTDHTIMMYDGSWDEYGSDPTTPKEYGSHDKIL